MIHSGTVRPEFRLRGFNGFVISTDKGVFEQPASDQICGGLGIGAQFQMLRVLIVGSGVGEIVLSRGRGISLADLKEIERGLLQQVGDSQDRVGKCVEVPELSVVLLHEVFLREVVHEDESLVSLFRSILHLEFVYPKLPGLIDI